MSGSGTHTSVEQAYQKQPGGWLCCLEAAEKSLAAQGLQKKQPAPASKVVDAEKSVAMEEKLPLVGATEGRAVARKEAS